MKTYAIAKITFLQIIRQPIFGVLLILSMAIMATAPSVTAFTMDDDNQMLQDLCLSTFLVAGLIMAAFSASGAVSDEIESQTILTIVSKPVNRFAFIAAKFLGVMAALALAAAFMTLTFIMVLRHGVLWAAYIHHDVPILVFGVGAAVIAIACGALANYVLDWQFAPTTMALGLPLLTFGAIMAGFFDTDWKIQPFGENYSLEVIAACMLLLLAVWVLAAVCIACSTRLSVVWTLLIAFSLLCLGMTWDYLILDKLQQAEPGVARTAWTALYAIVPNFQVFWMLDALNLKQHISAMYLLFVAAYAATYIIAMLFLAYALFLNRQVGAAGKI